MTKPLTPREKISKWEEKQREEKEKEKLFLKKHSYLLDDRGRLKFGVNPRNIEKLWKEFKKSLRSKK